MSDRPKLAAIAVSMAMLWVVVYWLTPAPGTASGEGDGVRITFGEPPAQDAGSVAEQFETQPESGQEPERPTTGTLEEAMSRVIPPEFGTYRVAYGDNAHTISRKLYGTTKHWQSVLKANALTDPTRFREGQTIRYAIDPKNIQGIPVDASGQRIDVSSKPTVEESQDAEYVVQRGDTLSGISKAIYGRATMWRTIRDANRDKVNSEGTNIRAGMVLRIPPPSASN